MLTHILTWLKKISYWVLLVTALVVLIIIAGSILWVNSLSRQIPDDRAITDFTHNAVTVIYDKDGVRMASLKENKSQIWISFSDMPDNLKKAIVATEDPYFFKHAGIDYRQTWESVKENLRVWRFVRGGSTITQQVAKNVYLTREKTITRKIKEYILARKIESLLPKERILEIYLNEAGWGYGIYGVELASRFYLDKPAAELTPADSAFLIAMLRNPALYNPYKNLDKVVKRQQLVLTLMLRHRLITKEEYESSLNLPIILRLDKKKKQYNNIRLDNGDDEKDGLSCYAGLMEEYLSDTVGRNLLYDVGLEIYTTLDSRLQNLLEELLRREENHPPSPPLSKGGIGGVVRDVVKIVLIKDTKGKVRAIGCSGKWKEVSDEIMGEMRKFNYPVNLNLSAAEFTTGNEISWKDILLISKGDRLL
ncbi:MAG: penicillin-binding protein [Nitrospirae bacterium]|nr:penicillin-binding protein [Nitrospirota bacterium]